VVQCKLVEPPSPKALKHDENEFVRSSACGQEHEQQQPADSNCSFPLFNIKGTIAIIVGLFYLHKT
jgi:hypothetical protein